MDNCFFSYDIPYFNRQYIEYNIYIYIFLLPLSTKFLTPLPHKTKSLFWICGDVYAFSLQITCPILRIQICTQAEKVAVALSHTVKDIIFPDDCSLCSGLRWHCICKCDNSNVLLSQLHSAQILNLRFCNCWNGKKYNASNIKEFISIQRAKNYLSTENHTCIANVTKK